MKCEFDHWAGLEGGESERAVDQIVPDWQGLRARFHAAHALRGALGCPPSSADMGGSFSGAGAHVLDGNRTISAPVNLDALGYGKSPSANDGLVAGPPNAATEE
jgi:hypothetical protein